VIRPRAAVFAGVALALLTLLAWAGPDMVQAETVATRVEQNDSNLAYVGAWNTVASKAGEASQRDLRWTDSPGASVIVQFSGTYLVWIAKTSPVYGIATVSVDGGPAANVDLYSSTIKWQQPVWDTGTLTEGSHNVTIRWSGSKGSAAGHTYVNVDAFDITGVLEKATAPPSSLTVAAGGDVLGDRGVGLFMDKNGGPAVFAQVQPYLAPADVAFVNLEGPISNVGSRVPGKEYTFRARPALAQGLLSGGVDVVSIANNHTLDYGSAALLDCIARLDAVGVKHAGAGANAAAAVAPALLDTPAGKVAVLAYSGIVPSGFAAGAGKPGIATTYDPQKIANQVAAAAKLADFVVVSFHWGVEYSPNANGTQINLAHRVVDAGADLVLGHHPHVIQGLEIYKNKLIAYSLGDFVFDRHSRPETGQAFVLQVSIPKEGRATGEIIPVWLSTTSGAPAPVGGTTAKIILDRLTGLSRTLGLQLTRAGDHATF
jgi:poly-gamma-glutamate capsule biosynthesis protein CapA/YwtB (metallophosphatase superfamily)